MLPLTLLFAAASPLAAWVTGRVGPALPVTLGLLAVTGSLVAVAGLTATASLASLAPCLAGLGAGLAFVIVGSAEAIITDLPVDDAGLAGGLQASAVQLGGVLGASLLGSVLASRAAGALPGALGAAGVPPPAAARVEASTPAVVQGLVGHLRDVPDRLHPAVIAGSHAAFMAGFRTAFLVGAGAALVGAAASPFLRGRRPSGQGVPTAAGPPP